MNFPSALIEDAVNEVAKLPGIGKKTALRLVLHLLKEDEQATHNLTEALRKVRENTRYCQYCHNISDSPVCSICENHYRDHTTICIVDDIRNVMAIENTGQYNGLYHVLGGLISPMEGQGPSELNIESLIRRVSEMEVKELIFALSPTMEGDTTAHYLTKKFENFSIKISTIARGVPFGGELEYTDEVTLGRSIVTRSPYDAS